MAAIEDLIAKIQDEGLRKQIAEEVNKLKVNKKFGLIYENHLPERAVLFDMPIKIGSKVTLRRDKKKIYQVAEINGETATCFEGEEQKIFPLTELLYVAEIGEPIYPYLKQLDSIKNAPTSDLWHTLIEAENYHALQLLDYMYHGKVDCIYIDPPYNTGAKDWKYNNDYVDGSDQYRHSKWLSMMEKRLKLAKELLNPADSVLIVTIDEKEYLHLGCLLEELFPDARIQMVNIIINKNGVSRSKEFKRSEEYAFFIMFGEASPVEMETVIYSPFTEKKNNNYGLFDALGEATNDLATPNEHVRWERLLRGGSNSLRTDRPNLFYPIYIDEKTKTIKELGDVISLSTDWRDIPNKKGLRALWPIRPDGTEATWRMKPSSLLERINKGFVRIGAYDKKNDRYSILYLADVQEERIKKGDIIITGHREDGSVIVEYANAKKSIPTTVWGGSLFSAAEYGSKIITKIFGDKRFSFPKSMYATNLTIAPFVANKKDALILDFFAGSGTTLHAVNLLNAEDGGKRRCILVTNNEVSLEEAKNFEKKGVQEGSDEWNALGIARFVTWPRTRCSILGENIKGEALKGNYLGSDRPMSEGFSANAIFFKLGFLDKMSVALGKQLQELISILWLKAGAFGECPPAEANEKYMIYRESNFAVLVDPVYVNEFKEKLSSNIETVYIITDYGNEFNNISAFLNIKKSYQLYKDYLENFKINTR